MTVWLLASAWGVVVVLISRAALVRSGTHRRAQALARPKPRRPRRGFEVPAAAMPFVHVAQGLQRHRRARQTRVAITQQLALVVDLVGVAVNAGTTPFLGVELAAQWAPRQIAARLSGIAHSVRLGVAFPDALATETQATPALRPLTEALLGSYRLGSPLGPTLQRVSTEARAAERRRAEARARTVPVRLLFPLVFLVLPAFVLLTVVPALVAGWREI